jgi:hypothetical protein
MLVGCSSKKSAHLGPSADGASPGGDAAPITTDGGVSCAFDDGVADPPCALGEQRRCNGKCFSTVGECKAGCRYVGEAWYPMGFVFENNIAYGFESGNVVRVNLATYESKTYVAPDLASFTSMVVRDGKIYFAGFYSIYVADQTGASQQWVQLPSDPEYLAQVGGTVFATGGPNEQLYAVAIDQPTPVLVRSGVWEIAYDDTYLYEYSAIDAGQSLSTNRCTVDRVATPTLVTRDMGVGSGQILGDYLYWYTSSASAAGPGYVRVPKGGGVVEPVMTTTWFKSTAAGKDVLFALDANGQVLRVQPGADSSVIARVDATTAQVVASDGTWPYVATTGNDDGALFRLLAE